MRQRGYSPWTPDVPNKKPPREPRPARAPGQSRSRINGTTLALIAGGTAFAAVVAVVVAIGLNHRTVEAGTPIAVSRSATTIQPTTTTIQTSDSSGPPTTSTVPAPPATSLSPGLVPSGYTAESGPAGIQVNIPSGWTITTPFASENEADDPAGSGSLIRYGGTPSPSMSLLDAISSDESSNTSVKNGYQQLQLNEVSSPTGDDTVVWEFLFDKNGVQRHVLSWFWRANGNDYVVYFSSVAANWSAMQSIASAVEQTVGPV